MPDLTGHIRKLEEMYKLRREISTQLHNQRCFSHAPTSSNFRISLMPRTTCRKITKTMAPRRQATPSLPRRTHPRKTHRWTLPRLRHSYALSLATQPFKCERETSRTSSSLSPTTCYMVSTRIGCTKIQETTWME